LVLFSILAIGYRSSHPEGAKALNYDSVTLATYDYNFAAKADGTIIRDSNQVPQPQLDAAGKPVPFTISYAAYDSTGKLFQAHPNAASVVSIHSLTG
jgi:hypothetical protein